MRSLIWSRIPALCGAGNSTQQELEPLLEEKAATTRCGAEMKAQWEALQAAATAFKDAATAAQAEQQPAT
jgi:hypothetical protein